MGESAVRNQLQILELLACCVCCASCIQGFRHLVAADYGVQKPAQTDSQADRVLCQKAEEAMGPSDAVH